MVWKMGAQIKAILFDKDGTLIDFDKSWEPVNREAVLIAAKGDLALADHLLDACGTDPATGKTRADSMFAAANADEIVAHMIVHGSPFAHDELRVKLEQIYLNGADHAVPIGDVEGLMGQLRQAGFVLGIASSDGEANIWRSVEGLKLKQHISFVAGYDSGYGPKPKAGMIEAFAHHLGLTTAEIAMVGDTNHDLEMARAAQAGAAIGVLSGTGTRESLLDLADVLVESVADLPDLI